MMAVTYEKIATTTLSSSAADVTFSTITGAYTDLVITCNFGAITASQDFAMRFNGDTGSNYSDTRLYGNGSGVVSGRSTSGTRINVDSAGVSTTLIAFDTININSYSNTTTYKTA